MPVPAGRAAPVVAEALWAGAPAGAVAVDVPVGVEVGTAVLVAGAVEVGDVAPGRGDPAGLAVPVGGAVPECVLVSVGVGLGPVRVGVGVGVTVGAGDTTGLVPVWEFPVVAVAVAGSGGRTMIHKANTPRNRTASTIVETRGRPAPDSRLLRLFIQESSFVQEFAFIRSSPSSGGWRRPRPRP
ncbi:MAG TPA: hypothetical protein VHF26_26630 [Trebonia sp.]|nr:hypothetical protein [Trebonia sp.]